MSDPGPRHESDHGLPPGPDPGLAGQLDLVLARLDRWRERPALTAAVVLLVGATVALGWWLGRPGTAAPVEDAIPMATPATGAGGPNDGPPTSPAPPEQPTEPEDVLVHVAGAVVEPGIVTLTPDARIGDAVAAAGGPTPEADLHQLNLAAPVSDGLQVRVPVMGEVAPPAGIPAPGAGAGGGNVGPDGEPVAPMVDVNTASARELEALPGIGPSLAAAIVEWRTANGPFTSVDQLIDVPGIGPAKLERLAGSVVL